MKYNGILRRDIKMEIDTKKYTLLESTLNLPKELIETLDQVNLEFEMVWVFGSWAKGKQHEKSDLDLFVLSNKGHVHANDVCKKINPLLDVRAIKRDELYKLEREVTVLHKRK